MSADSSGFIHLVCENEGSDQTAQTPRLVLAVVGLIGIKHPLCMWQFKSGAGVTACSLEPDHTESFEIV